MVEITRRDFLMGTAGFIVACGAGYTSWMSLCQRQATYSCASAFTNSQYVGPRLFNGIKLVSQDSGAGAYYNGQLLFTANQSGKELLELADGSRKFSQITQQAGLGDEDISEVVSFFGTLSDAGFLEQQFEVSLFEVRV